MSLKTEKRPSQFFRVQGVVFQHLVLSDQQTKSKKITKCKTRKVLKKTAADEFCFHLLIDYLFQLLQSFFFHLSKGFENLYHYLPYLSGNHLNYVFSEPCQPVIASAQALCNNVEVQISWHQASGVENYLVTATGSLGYVKIHNTSQTLLSAAFPCGQDYNVTVQGQGSECDSIPSSPAFFKTSMITYSTLQYTFALAFTLCVYLTARSPPSSFLSSMYPPRCHYLCTV